MELVLTWRKDAIFMQIARTMKTKKTVVSVNCETHQIPVSSNICSLAENIQRISHIKTTVLVYRKQLIDLQCKFSFKLVTLFLKT